MKQVTLLFLALTITAALHAQTDAKQSLLKASTSEALASKAGPVSVLMLPQLEVCKSTRCTGQRRYELNDHLQNVRAVVSDRRLATNAGATIATYRTEVHSWDDFYAFGQPLNGRHVSAYIYRFAFNGMERDNEVKGNNNSYTTAFRFNDPRVGRWWSIDPVRDMERSPYNSMGNNPIAKVDPHGTREFSGYDAYVRYAKKNGFKPLPYDKMGSDGHWLGTQRKSKNKAWYRANKFNLTQNPNGAAEYRSIPQRRDFYKWFDKKVVTKQGHEITWVYAAKEVVKGVDDLHDNSLIVTINEGIDNSRNLMNFTEKLNTDIFNNVFPELKKVYERGADGKPLKGQDAKDWDSKVLHTEQFEVAQPLYDQLIKQKPETYYLMQRLLKQEGSYGTFATLAGNPLPAFTGTLSKAQDRFDYGMKIAAQRPKK